MDYSWCKYTYSCRINWWPLEFFNIWSIVIFYTKFKDNNYICLQPIHIYELYAYYLFLNSYIKDNYFQLKKKNEWSPINSATVRICWVVLKGKRRFLFGRNIFINLLIFSNIQYKFFLFFRCCFWRCFSRHWSARHGFGVHLVLSIRRH